MVCDDSKVLALYKTRVLSVTRAPANYPLVVGHEIVGKAVRVGKDVKGIKVGDRYV